MANMEWTGVEQMVARMQVYADKVQSAVLSVATYFQPVIEAYAKQNASWEDQTGNARQTLHSFVKELSKDTVELYLAHGVDYGIYLEVAHAGKYAIIYPTLQAHLQDIANMLKGIFG